MKTYDGLYAAKIYGKIIVIFIKGKYSVYM